MLELYNMMQKMQGKPIPTEPIKPTLNLKEKLKFLINYFNSIKDNTNLFEQNSKEMDIFYLNDIDSMQATQLSKIYNIPLEEVKKWLNDLKYKNLVNQKMTLIKLEPYFEKKIETLLMNIFSLKEDMWLAFWTQRPGQMAPLHYDRPKYLDFNTTVENEKNIKRYLIFLDDQKEGQIFYMAGQYISWRAGDVLEWDQTSYQHGSANFGYYDRPTLLITGVEK